jgi:hypothetical protein
MKALEPMRDLAFRGCSQHPTGRGTEDEFDRRVFIAAPRTMVNNACQNQLKPCRGKAFDLWNELQLESQKEIRLNADLSLDGVFQARKS